MLWSCNSFQGTFKTELYQNHTRKICLFGTIETVYKINHAYVRGINMNRFLNDRNDRLLYFANLICRIFIPGFNKWYRDNKKNMSV